MRHLLCRLASRRRIQNRVVPVIDGVPLMVRLPAHAEDTAGFGDHPTVPINREVPSPPYLLGVGDWIHMIIVNTCYPWIVEG